MREFDAGCRPFEGQQRNLAFRGVAFGAGPALVVAGGIESTTRLFALLAWLLRERFETVFIDCVRVPGRRRAWVSIDDHADCLAAAARQAGHSRAAIFGSGQGSMCALAALHRHPGLFESAVLQAAYAGRELSVAERLLALVGTWLPGRAAVLPLRRLFAQANHRQWFPPFDATRWRFFLDETGARPIAEMARRARLASRRNLWHIVPHISQPVLVVRAEGEGHMLQRAAEALAAGLPNATTQYLPGTGRLPFLTHPHRLAALLTEYFSAESRHPYQRHNAPGRP